MRKEIGIFYNKTCMSGFFPIALMQTLLEDVESLKFERKEIKLAAVSPSMIDYYISPMLLCLTRN